MSDILEVAELRIELIRKRIKNIHLTVRPPDGAVRITSPLRMDRHTLKAFAESKLDWIRKKRGEMLEKERETPREYVEGECHSVWGLRCLLEIEETKTKARVEWEEGRLRLRMRPGSDTAKREALVEGWYRDQVRQALGPLVEKWSLILGVRVAALDVRRMKSKWGSCSPGKRLVRFNSELGKKPPECLEYVVVHELAHLIEASHNARFKALLGRHLPDWKRRRDLLNRFSF
ncbi:MAG TPA: SprT family zinc-dependent metalloprotease [Rectinemataceae bacterium]|nr:SprT family zinc-dependent metalloprotease [Rectinemataceae bacterium]